MQEEGVSDGVRWDHDQTSSISKHDFVGSDPLRGGTGPGELEDLQATNCDTQLEPVSALLK
jgi:hypothetical protein